MKLGLQNFAAVVMGRPSLERHVALDRAMWGDRDERLGGAIRPCSADAR